MALKFLELEWTETPEGFTLTMGFNQPVWPFEEEEVSQVAEACGFVASGVNRWTAPADPNAPAKLWEALKATGYTLQMDMRTLPPALAAMQETL